jgi:hypothetical protein
VAITLGSTYLTEATGTYTPTLALATPPKNSGVVIANITDGFSGVAPDRSAIIAGRTPVNYGDDSTEWVIPTWPQAYVYWWYRPDVYDAGYNTPDWAWWNFYYYGQYEGSQWRWELGAVCNAAAEKYFQDRPDVRADGYYGRDKWGAFEHFNNFGVYEGSYWYGNLCAW